MRTEERYKPTIHVASLVSKRGLSGSIYVARLWVTRGGFNIVVPVGTIGDRVPANVVFRIVDPVWDGLVRRGIAKLVEPCMNARFVGMPSHAVGAIIMRAKTRVVNAKTGEVEVGCFEMYHVDTEALLSEHPLLLSRVVWLEENGIEVEVIHPITSLKPVNGQVVMPVSITLVPWDAGGAETMEILAGTLGAMSRHLILTDHVFYSMTHSVYVDRVLDVIQKMSVPRFASAIGKLRERIANIATGVTAA